MLISALLFGGLPRVILHTATRGEITLVTSPALLDELEDLLIGKFGFGRAVARLTRGEVEALADLVQPVDVPAVSRDADDDEVPAADVVVTGDRDLLALGTHQGISVLTPREFADLRQRS
ncbi:MAG: PIN domain-containing protein [Egibacteraceae bacterium]